MSTKYLKSEASTVGAIKGFSAPFGSKPTKKRKEKKNPNKPYGESELFENAVIMSILNKKKNEVVRKRGDQWTVFDDDTGAQLDTFPTRSAAWEKQRQIRQTRVGAKRAAGAEKQRQVKGLSPDIEKIKLLKKPDVAKSKPKKTKDLPTLAKKPVTAKTAKITKQKRQKTEEIVRSALRSVLKEASMISYIFENPPEEGSMWENFVGRLSNETILQTYRKS